MITLHGFAASNYYNLIKHVLLYKKQPFKERLIYGGSGELSAISSAGKVPVITTYQSVNISESSVIFDFNEEADRLANMPKFMQKVTAQIQAVNA